MASRVEEIARKHTRKTGRWLVVMARAGYVAKGMVYVLIGGIAVRAALGADRPEGSIGALAELFGAPLGAVLAALIAVGLACFGVWRLIRGLANPEDDGPGTRLASLGSGAFHVGLAFAAARVVWQGGDHDEGGEKRWAALVMDAPAGKWILLAIALGIGANGARRLYRAWKIKLDDELELHEVNPTMRRLIIHTARFGMAARGAVFLLIALFLSGAALRSNPAEARGIGATLQTMLGKRYGITLLGITAAGLIAYGIYQFILARYRRVETH